MSSHAGFGNPRRRDELACARHGGKLWPLDRPAGSLGNRGRVDVQVTVAADRPTPASRGSGPTDRGSCRRDRGLALDPATVDPYPDLGGHGHAVRNSLRLPGRPPYDPRTRATISVDRRLLPGPAPPRCRDGGSVEHLTRDPDLARCRSRRICFSEVDSGLARRDILAGGHRAGEWPAGRDLLEPQRVRCRMARLREGIPTRCSGPGSERCRRRTDGRGPGPLSRL